MFLSNTTPTPFTLPNRSARKLFMALLWAIVTPSTSSTGNCPNGVPKKKKERVEKTVSSVLQNIFAQVINWG